MVKATRGPWRFYTVEGQHGQKAPDEETGPEVGGDLAEASGDWEWSQGSWLRSPEFKSI